jgi:outer membrane protein TolC
MRLKILILWLLLPASAQAQRRLSLGEAIAIAKSHRSETAQAGIDVERAELGVLKARLERIHLTIQGTAAEQVQDLNVQLTGTPMDICMGAASVLAGTTCDTTSHNYRGTADLTIPIWSGFQIEADVARARWLQRATDAQRKVTARTIALDVAHAYWGVRRAELLREVEAQAVARDQEIEQIIRSRVGSGIAPQVDFNRAHVSTLRELGQLASLDGQIAEARAQLGAVLQIDEDIALSEDPATHAPLMPPLADVVEIARHERPELLAAQAQVVAQAEAVRSARGAYWPQLQLFAHADVSNANFVLSNVPQEELFGNFVAGLRVNWTIFDTLTTWATVRDAEYQRSRLEEDRVRARFQIDADVKGAHARLQKGMSQKTTLEEAAKVARDNLDIIRKRYEAGDALVIELLDAQVQLLRAESDLVDNSVSIAQADAELASAEGRL